MASGDGVDPLPDLGVNLTRMLHMNGCVERWSPEMTDYRPRLWRKPQAGAHGGGPRRFQACFHGFLPPCQPPFLV